MLDKEYSLKIEEIIDSMEEKLGILQNEYIIEDDDEKFFQFRNFQLALKSLYDEERIATKIFRSLKLENLLEKRDIKTIVDVINNYDCGLIGEYNELCEKIEEYERILFKLSYDNYENVIYRSVFEQYMQPETICGQKDWFIKGFLANRFKNYLDYQHCICCPQKEMKKPKTSNKASIKNKSNINDKLNKAMQEISAIYISKE